MNKSEINTVRINLRHLWDQYRKRTARPITQAEFSKALGYSSSAFGKMLNGSSEISTANVIKIANFFHCTPNDIDPGFNAAHFGRGLIWRTTSGKPPPAEQTIFQYMHPSWKVLFNDERLEIKVEHQVAQIKEDKSLSRGFLPNTILLLSPDDTDIVRDRAFPEPQPPIFIVIPRGKRTEISGSPEKIWATAREHRPKVKNADVYRLVAIWF